MGNLISRLRATTVPRSVPAMTSGRGGRSAGIRNPGSSGRPGRDHN